MHTSIDKISVNSSFRTGHRSKSKECVKETTPWSACSVSCGMGVSIRVTNDNEDCVATQQKRLCLVRPCELNDKHLVSANTDFFIHQE